MEVLSFEAVVTTRSTDLTDWQDDPELVTTISPRDRMNAEGNVPGYHWVGRAALDSILAVLRAASKEARDVRRILDFGCGHGRVCRRLRRTFRESAITVSDVDRDGVDFCAEHFRGAALYSSSDLREVTLDAAAFDLVWAGSVFSHLDRTSWSLLLGLFADALDPGGVLAFSFEGPFSYRYFTSGRYAGIEPRNVERIRQGYEGSGFGHASYVAGVTDQSNYGRTFVTRDAVCAILDAAGFVPIVIVERGYGGLQDVVGCRKR